MNASIPDDLMIAARNLEERFRLLEVPTRRVEKAEWNQLEEGAQAVPDWLQELLSLFSLVGGVLEYRDRRGTGRRLFSFVDPAGTASLRASGSLARKLPSFGFLPCGYEADGSLWVSRTDVHAGPIYLLELPEWNGEEPAAQNGLIFAADRLSFLLASMGVSEASYYSSSPVPRCVMWYKSPVR